MSGEDLFFGDHLAVKGTKIPFKGREFWRICGEDPNGRLGTPGNAAHIKLQSFFAQNLNKKFDRRSEKKAIQKTELHFI